MFFVLSGFLITGILVDSEGTPGWLSNFYLRRASRILPLYFAVTIISFVILPHIQFSKSARFSTIGQDEIWYWLMLPNVAIAKAGLLRHGIMDVSWSVAIEEHYYLIWPFLLAALKPNQRVKLCVGTMIATFTLRTGLALEQVNPISLNVSTPTHLDGLAMGSLIALLIRADPERIWQMRAGKRLFTFGLIATVFLCLGGMLLTPQHFASYFYNILMNTLGYPATAATFAGLLLCTWAARDDASRLTRFLSLPVLRTFGKYSYCLYLTNLPIRAAIRDLLIKPERFRDMPGGVIGGQLIFYVAALCACLAVAFLSWHLFEKQFLRLAPSHSRRTVTDEAESPKYGPAPSKT